MYGPGDVPLFFRVWIPADDLMAIRGLRRTTITSDGKSRTEQIADFGLPSEMDIRELRWDGTLQIPRRATFIILLLSMGNFLLMVILGMCRGIWGVDYIKSA